MAGNTPSIGGFDDKWAVFTAEIRLRNMALSIGDATAIALASTLGAPLLTADKAFLKSADFAQIELIR